MRFVMNSMCRSATAGGLNMVRHHAVAVVGFKLILIYYTEALYGS